MSGLITKVLIANRGEIAVRIARELQKIVAENQLRSMQIKIAIACT